MNQTANPSSVTVLEAGPKSTWRPKLFAVAGAIIGGILGVFISQPPSALPPGMSGPDAEGYVYGHMLGSLLVPAVIGAAIGWFCGRKKKRG